MLLSRVIYPTMLKTILNNIYETFTDGINESWDYEQWGLAIVDLIKYPLATDYPFAYTDNLDLTCPPPENTQRIVKRFIGSKDGAQVQWCWFIR